MLVLTENNTFHFRSKSSSAYGSRDSNGKRIWIEEKVRGFGEYEIQGDSLRMIFLNEDSIRIVIQKTSVDNSKNYIVELYSEKYRRISPVVQLASVDSGKQKNFWPDEFDNCEFTIKNESKLKYLTFPLELHFVDEELKFDLATLKEGYNEFKFKTFNGYYSKGYCKSIWFKNTFLGIRIGPKKLWYKHHKL